MIIEMTVTFVLFFSLVGFVIDGGRWMAFKNEITHAAQAASMSGARFLNQEPGSINKARSAATDVANANLAMLDGLSSASMTSLKICSAIPCVETSHDDQAKYVEIVIAGETQRIFVTPFALVASAKSLN